MNTDIRIEANKREDIAGLSRLFTDSFTLHLMFETTYNESRRTHTPPKETR